MGRCVTFICGIVGAFSSSASAAQYITFAVPGAWSTNAIAINGSSVAGIYSVPQGKHGSFTSHGFIRHADGAIETYDPIDALNTYPMAMNSNGTIVGYYAIRLNRARWRGYMRSPDGKITLIKVKHAKNVTPSGINAAGWIIGEYELFDSSQHAFLRAPDGSVSTFQVPGADVTTPVSINKSGAITGTWGNYGTYATHAFVRNLDGSFATFDMPKAVGTVPRSIDNAGRVFGFFENRHVKDTAFLRDADGTLTKIEVPGAEQTLGVDLTAQPNGTATAVGYALDSNSHALGYLRSGKGEITTFEAPGALAAGTFPVSINGQKWIAGSYDAQSCYPVDCIHAFIRIP